MPVVGVNQPNQAELEAHEAMHFFDPNLNFRTGPNRIIAELGAYLGQKSRIHNSKSSVVSYAHYPFAGYLRAFGIDTKLSKILQTDSTDLQTLATLIPVFLEKMVAKFPPSQLSRMMMSCKTLDQVLARLAAILPEEFGGYDYLYEVEQLREEMASQ